MKGVITLALLVSVASRAEDISQCKQGWYEYQSGSYNPNQGHARVKKIKLT